MFQRPLFWLGLLLGGSASFGLRRRWLPVRPTFLDPLLDLVSDAVIRCDAFGAVIGANAAARELFGPEAAGLFRLAYPSGQLVPPGQLPMNRALRTGKAVEGAGYRFVSADGKVYVLDMEARPLPDGGVVVTARDRTEIGQGLARETKTQSREETLRTLCRRLSAAPDAEELAQALVESARTLAEELPDVRARLYAYDPDAKLLTRLAAAPRERPKRPRSLQQAQPPAFPFDASLPLLWSVYIERQPAFCADVAGNPPLPTSWGEETRGSACVLPLLAGGVALGHLSLTSSAGAAFDDTGLQDSLGLLTSVAALALAGPRQAASAEGLAMQVEALRAVIQAIGVRTAAGALADRVSREVCRVTGAEVCTLALQNDGSLRLAGTTYQDALLSPSRTAPDDPALIGKATREAVQKGKTIQRTGVANPTFEAGVWRAFAGQAGRHCIVSVPLAERQGALTVYTAGDAPLPEAQVKFLETLTALVSAGLHEASLSAGRTGS